MYNLTSTLLEQDCDKLLTISNSAYNKSSIDSFCANSTRSGHQLSSVFSAFAGTTLSLIVFLAVVCNSVLIWTIVTTKKLHSVTHVFIVNLAIGDLITASVTVPFDIDFMFRGYFDHGKVACAIMHVSFFLSLPSSVINLCLLTLERFIGMRFPFRKLDWINSRNIVIIMICTWMYTLLVAIFPLIYNSHAILLCQGYCLIEPNTAYDFFQLIVNCLIPIIIILLLNISLFVMANNHVKLKQNAITQLVQRKQGEGKAIIVNMKAAKRIMLLVGIFVICWFSFFLLVVHNIACGYCHSRELTWLGNIVNYSSIAINPILYGVCKRQVRKAIMAKLTNTKKKLNLNEPVNNRILSTAV